MSTQVLASNENSSENRVPIHTTAKVAGTKIAVRSHSGGLNNFCVRPITMDKSK